MPASGRPDLKDPCMVQRGMADLFRGALWPGSSFFQEISTSMLHTTAGAWLALISLTPSRKTATGQYQVPGPGEPCLGGGRDTDCFSLLPLFLEERIPLGFL